jgi:hypothetical protein
VTEERKEIVLVLDLGAFDMSSVSRSASSINYNLEASDEIDIMLGFGLDMDIEDFQIGHPQHVETLFLNDDDMEAAATLFTINSAMEAQWEELSQEEGVLLMNERLAAATSAASTGYICQGFPYLGNDTNNNAETTKDVSDDEWHECREGSPNPFSDSEYELSDNTYTESEHEFADNNDIQSECSAAPLLAGTRGHEEESEDHRPFYALTKDERDVYFQMTDIVRSLEHKAETVPSVAFSPDFVTAWRHFELAMFGFAANPGIGEVPVGIPVVVDPESASELAQFVGEVPWEIDFN